MRVIAWIVALLMLSVMGVAHPTGKAKGISKAAKKLAEASRHLEAYKAKLHGDGNYSCCIKPPAKSKTVGCTMCAINNGSCNCAANLMQGKGVCGECKGGWVNGKGKFDLRLTGAASAKAIPVLPAGKQGIDGVAQDPNDPNLVAYRALILESKKILVSEKRFSCCVGKGGCDECALESSCGCGPSLAADVLKKADEKKEGVCGQCLDGQHAGIGRIAGVQHEHVHVAEMEMPQFGSFSTNMAQEGSGTSWLPGTSPMHMIQLGKYAGYDLTAMGLATVNFADAGGKRGESQLFTNSMAMLMAQKEVGEGTLTLRGMLSLDALTNGKKGYPNLFQTGETANGKPLKDRQHPHDLFMELAAIYSKPVTKDTSAFIYLAPVGEPALGTAAFQHRPSAWDNPEAPINHHWNDGTHISYGVISAGINVADRWKIDGSIFNGREPNENRFDFDKIRLDSYSGRVTHNPNANWSLSASYGYLNSPETLEPGVNQHRLAGAAFHNSAVGGGNLALGLIFGRNLKHGTHTDALAVEGAWSKGKDTWFARWENVQKDELVDVPEGTYRIQKYTLGYTRDFATKDGLSYGLGVFADLYSYPRALEASYGKRPVSFGVFLRIRPQ